MLSEEELLAVLAHELTHVQLYTQLNGEVEVADRIITAMANNGGSTSAHYETARLFKLYTEIFCDRGAYAVTGNYAPIISSLVKIATGLQTVNADSYIKQAADVHYSLAVLVDDDAHYTNNDLVEQYYQRPSILQSFGWKIINVYAKDWFEDSNRVINEIERALEGIKQEAVEQKIKKETPVEIQENETVYHSFLSSGGDRFWEIAQVNKQLHIRSGKTSMKGQTLVKTLSTEDEAIAMMQTLIEEKEAEGFTVKP
jgi:predicted DNA-binding WGR domain protein